MLQNSLRYPGRRRQPLPDPIPGHAQAGAAKHAFRGAGRGEQSYFTVTLNLAVASLTSFPLAVTSTSKSFLLSPAATFTLPSDLPFSMVRSFGVKVNLESSGALKVTVTSPS